VGCCGWTEAQARYVRDFAAIELQSTFYDPPAPAVARKWKALAPPDFRFCMKAWQLITHTPASPTYRKLRQPVGAEERNLYGSFRQTEQVRLAWERTRQIAGILGAQVVVFQCPASFLPTRENLRNFRAFFADLERDGRMLAWEPRGDEWQPELVRDLCEESALIHCVDPFKTEAMAGEAAYWRLHGRGGYRYRYTEEDFAELSAMMRERAELAGPNYVMFNNIYSLPDAARFLDLYVRK